MPHSIISERRISLVAGAILIAVTLLVGVTVFTVMRQNAEELLSKSLQSSLSNRVQFATGEIRGGLGKAVSISTRPLLIDQLVRVNARADDTAARSELDKAARSFVQNGLLAVALYGENGRELAHAGVFTPQPELAVPVNLPGHVQLLWKGKFLLWATVDFLKAGHVVGKVMIETDLAALGNMLTEAKSLGETGELALCAPFGLKMQCFPGILYPHVQTISLRSANGDLLPMAHALAGETGFVTTLDYRAHEVAAAYAPVGDLGLGTVLKIDSAELYAPVWQQLRYLIPFLLGTLIIALLLLRWLLTPLVVRLIRSEAEAVQRTTALTKEIAERKQAGTQLHESEERYRSLITGMAEGVVLQDADGVILTCNPSAERILGLSQKDMAGRTPSDPRWGGIHEDGSAFLEKDNPDLVALHTGLPVADIIMGLRRPDANMIWISINAQPLFRPAESKPYAVVVTFNDITERRQAEEDLQVSKERLELALRAANEGTWDMDIDSGRLHFSTEWGNLLGYKEEEIPRHVEAWRNLIHPDDKDRVLKAMHEHQHGRSPYYDAEYRIRSTSGEWVWIQERGKVIQKDQAGKPVRMIGITQDITERKMVEEKIQHLAFYDPLTQLPNRRLLMDRLQQALAASARSGRSGALLFLDLDNFKSLNDTLGHEAGDLLLEQVARRLESCVRGGDTVARLGGDEFVVVLEVLSHDPLEAAAQAEAIGEKILAALNQPYPLATQEYRSSASIGITLFNGQQSSLEELLKQADIAMYQAKKEGRNTLRFFDPKM